MSSSAIDTATDAGWTLSARRSGAGAAWRAVTGSRGPLDPRLLVPVPPRAVALRMLNNLRATFTSRGDEHGLGILARLRGAYPELAGEREEHERWLRIWN